LATSITNTLATNTTTGLGTGIDVQQFVQLALAGAQANITNLQNEQTALNSQTSAIAQITSDLNNLQSAAFALSDPLGALAAQTTNSSNSNVLTATAASTASPGTHTISVTSLATTSSYYSAAAPSSSAALSGGSFQIQIGGGTPTTVTVLGGGSYQFQTGSNAPVTVNNGDATLNGLVNASNSQNLGVNTNVIQDASGARLALVSGTSGAPGDLTVTGNVTLSSGNTPLNFTKAVTGTNAQLTVDGVPVTSTSNTVSGVINGVTLNLNSPSPSTPVTLTVSPDTTETASAINNFVSAYNTAIKDINAQFAVNSDGSGGGPLQADGSLQQAQSILLTAISGSSAASGNNGIVNLASIGVNLNDDGTLTVDSGTLQSALSSNSAGVQNFFQAESTGFANNLSNAVTSIADSSTGVLGLDAQGITQSSQGLNQQISDLQASLAVQQQNLTQVYAQVNTTLQELPLLQNQLAQQLAGA
jgi:flagellar hook-associated protein 2